MSFVDAARDVVPSFPRYRLILLDVDGTLVGHDDIPSPRTIAALRAAKEIGCTVVICTGRNRHAAEHIAAHWETGSGFGVYCNGAIICESDTGRLLHRQHIPPALVRQAALLAYEYDLAPLCYGVHVEEDSGMAVYTDHHCPVYPPYMEHYGYRMAFSEEDFGSPGVAERMAPIDIGVYGAGKQVRPLADAWRKALGDEVVIYDCPEPRFATDCWAAFVNHSSVNKAYAARWVAEQLQIPQEQTLAIGDQLNDVEMLRWAGLGICMGNGHEELRECADHVTATLWEDGVAVAIERFVLGPHADAQ